MVSADCVISSFSSWVTRPRLPVSNVKLDEIVVRKSVPDGFSVRCCRVTALQGCAFRVSNNRISDWNAVPFSLGKCSRMTAAFFRVRSSKNQNMSNGNEVGIGDEHKLGGTNGPSFLHSVSAVSDAVKWAWFASPPTWESSLVAASLICIFGLPILLAGLTGPGVFSTYILCAVLWRAFGGQGVSIAAFFFVLATAATKVKLKQKQLEGTAEKRSGRRGPPNVLGSASAGVICAMCSIFGIGGPEFASLWALGYVASFCTKLSDTTSSEIGKAFGKTTYLVTNLSVVPRGTEGAVSLEGTLAGFISSTLLAAFAYAIDQVDITGAVICVTASQVANFFESFLGATLQGQEGFIWLSNDLVNMVNITVGAAFAILSRRLIS